MTYEIDAVGRSIVAQVAFKEACNVLGGEASPADILRFTQEGFNTIIAVATGGVTTVAQLPPTPAPVADAGLQQAFPGAVPVNPGVPAPIQAVQAVQPAAVGGPAITAESGEDEIWADALINNPDQWWNNIGNKKSPTGPDFSHKSIPGKNPQFKLGIWVKGQYGNAPAWVQENLRAAGHNV